MCYGGKRCIYSVADNPRAIEREAVGLEPHITLKFRAENDYGVRKCGACEPKDKPFFQGERLVLGIKTCEREQISRSLQIVFPDKVAAGADDNRNAEEPCE